MSRSDGVLILNLVLKRTCKFPLAFSLAPSMKMCLC
jgi:hypothetical protein